MDSIQRVYLAMMEYFSGDPKRIQHFTKVHAYARLIGNMEQLSAPQQNILETAALVHDIGIRPAEEKYGRCTGSLQEKEGPAEARKLLEALCLPADVVDRVCYLVGHHHTYENMDGEDYRILVEADFLVNFHEDNISKQAISSAMERIFTTKSGTFLCRTMFGLDAERS